LNHGQGLFPSHVDTLPEATTRIPDDQIAPARNPARPLLIWARPWLARLLCNAKSFFLDQFASRSRLLTKR